MLKVAYSPIFAYDVPERHRFPMQKYPMIAKRLLAEGTLTQDNFFAPQLLSEDEILTTHTAEYWQHLKNQTLPHKDARAIGFEMSSKLVERERYISHATYECALYAQQHGVSLNIAGGTHHAFADHGEGFCVFNDLAVASNLLLARGQGLLGRGAPRTQGRLPGAPRLLASPVRLRDAHRRGQPGRSRRGLDLRAQRRQGLPGQDHVRGGAGGVRRGRPPGRARHRAVRRPEHHADRHRRPPEGAE